MWPPPTIVLRALAFRRRIATSSMNSRQSVSQPSTVHGNGGRPGGAYVSTSYSRAAGARPCSAARKASTPTSFAFRSRPSRSSIRASEPASCWRSRTTGRSAFLRAFTSEIARRSVALRGVAARALEKVEHRLTHELTAVGLEHVPRSGDHHELSPRDPGREDPPVVRRDQ